MKSSHEYGRPEKNKTKGKLMNPPELGKYQA
jgi:hypothetical protein